MRLLAQKGVVENEKDKKSENYVSARRGYVGFILCAGESD